MTKTTLNTRTGISWIAARTHKLVPQICFAPEGIGHADDEAAKKAAEETAAKAAAEQAHEKAEEKAKDKPSDKEAELLKDVMKQKEARKKAEADAKAAIDALKKFEDIDPDVVRRLLAEQSENEKKVAEAKGDFERVKSMMRDEHAKEIEKLKKEIADRDTKITSVYSQVDDLTVGAAFSNSRFVKDELVLTPAKTRTVYGAHFEMVDGELTAFDKPKGAANRTKLVNSAGDVMSFDEAIKNLVDADGDRDTILRSKQKEGTGSKPDASGRTTTTVGKLGSGMSRIEAALNAKKKA